MSIKLRHALQYDIVVVVAVVSGVDKAQVKVGDNLKVTLTFIGQQNGDKHISYLVQFVEHPSFEERSQLPPTEVTSRLDDFRSSAEVSWCRTATTRTKDRC